MQLTLRATASLGMLTLLLAACNNTAPGTVAAPTPTFAQPSPTASPSLVPTLTPTTPPPSPTASPKPKPPSYDVKAVQTQLTAQKYYLGPIDGTPGPALRSAVMAFQKVNGLGRDGGVGPNTLAALKKPVTPKLLAISRGGQCI